MTGRSDPDVELGPAAQRLDRWLWFARIFKSRTLAAGLIEAGKIRVNAVKVLKPSYNVKPGDVITSSAQRDVRVIEVKGPGTRRGPALEAQALYCELTPKPIAMTPAGADLRKTLNSGQRESGAGRPTKRDRRLFERLQGRD
jgi:ribosome-associated heat shock protein Hsp15